MNPFIVVAFLTVFALLPPARAAVISASPAKAGPWVNPGATAFQEALADKAFFFNNNSPLQGIWTLGIHLIETPMTVDEKVSDTACRALVQFIAEPKEWEAGAPLRARLELALGEAGVFSLTEAAQRLHREVKSNPDSQLSALLGQARAALGRRPADVQWTNDRLDALFDGKTAAEGLRLAGLVQGLFDYSQPDEAVLSSAQELKLAIGQKPRAAEMTEVEAKLRGTLQAYDENVHAKIGRWSRAGELPELDLEQGAARPSKRIQAFFELFQAFLEQRPELAIAAVRGTAFSLMYLPPRVRQPQEAGAVLWLYERALRLGLTLSERRPDLVSAQDVRDFEGRLREREKEAYRESFKGSRAYRWITTLPWVSTLIALPQLVYQATGDLGPTSVATLLILSPFLFRFGVLATLAAAAAAFLIPWVGLAWLAGTLCAGSAAGALILHLRARAAAKGIRALREQVS